MKRRFLLAAGLGLALATAVVAVVGVGAVAKSALTVGWRGLALLTVYSLLPLALLACAWFVLEKPWRSGRWSVYAWARAIRDASGELLPFSHLGGAVIGARAAILGGVAAPWAFAATVVDVTTEMLAQLGFTAVGLALLALRLSDGSANEDLITAATAGLLISAAAAGAFIFVQRRGVGLVRGLANRFLPGAADGVEAAGMQIAAIYGRPARFAGAVAIHLIAWVASGFGVWLALRVGGVHVGPLDIVALEALVTAARSAVVVAPMGMGVQEAAYALLGPMFGLSPDIALAISLIKRARDVIFGVPVLLIWQGQEGRRLLVRGSGA